MNIFIILSKLRTAALPDLSHMALTRIRVHLIALYITAAAAFAGEVSNPYEIRLDGNAVRIRNTSSRFLEITFVIEGSNFLSHFPCSTTVWLEPRGESNPWLVDAKHREIPADFRITVSKFMAAQTRDDLPRQGGLLLQLTTDEQLRELQSVTCESW